jgi:HEAT repeat protein
MPGRLPFFEPTLLAAASLAAALWAVLSAYVVTVQRRRRTVRAAIARALGELQTVAALPLPERLERMRPLLDASSREMIMHAAADADTPQRTFDVLAAYLVDKWGIDMLERCAGTHRTGRDKWRRLRALEILVRLDHDRSIDLLAKAVEQDDVDIATVAFTALGASNHPKAGELLLTALCRQRHPASRIVAHIDRSPLYLADDLRALVGDSDPTVRRWAATLLGRYLDVVGLEADLAHLSRDRDPQVRKAAIESLGRIGDELAAETAVGLLNDSVSFVRATAARAIGRLGRIDLAEDVAVLLGDHDWWVRLAAKETLEALGTEVWPVLARLLDHSDRFVRNGAAEVFQNLGVLDSFILMEAATFDPAGAKLEMLRRIALAGGLRLTDSLIERAGTKMGPRVRALLSNIGLERVGAA